MPFSLRTEVRAPTTFGRLDETLTAPTWTTSTPEVLPVAHAIAISAAVY
jgi:hypothetical protein